MMHVSIKQQASVFEPFSPAHARRIPLPVLRAAALEILSIGSFLCVCLALIAEFS